MPRFGLNRFTIAVASFVVGVCVAVDALSFSADDKYPPCNVEQLPAELQTRLKSDFAPWKIQDSSSLSLHARPRWQGEKPLACPGIAVGEFKRPSQISYAVLLVPSGNPDTAYRLIIFTPSDGASPTTLETVDEWDKGGATNNFIHSVRIAKVFSPEWVRKLNVKTKDAVLAVEAGENEYGVEVYFSSGGHYRHEPIDY